MNKLCINGNLYIDTDATVQDYPDEDMIEIINEIEKLVHDKLGIKLVAHEAELTDEKGTVIGIYET